ncbi:MAG: hypothetical protein EBV59_09220 [Synechococcaceae bacterium WB7_1C_051]|nr:hypothetical protein [Synechococcaceae bacterium WB7_1C_051]
MAEVARKPFGLAITTIQAKWLQVIPIPRLYLQILQPTTWFLPTTLEVVQPIHLPIVRQRVKQALLRRKSILPILPQT